MYDLFMNNMQAFIYNICIAIVSNNMLIACHFPFPNLFQTKMYLKFWL